MPRRPRTPRPFRLGLKSFQIMYQNKRVIYTKQGQKHGWTGVVTEVFQKGGTRINVLFDNGIEQSYRLDALHYAPKSWGAHDTYLELERDEDKQAKQDYLDFHKNQ